MTPDEKKLLQDIAFRLNRLERSDRYVFEKSIATRAGIKMAFFGLEPIVQQSAIGAPTGAGGAYAQAQVQSVVDAVNSIRVALKAYGFIK